MATRQSLVFSLLRTHETQDFNSGSQPLDTWLHQYAYQAEQSKSARTYVLCLGSHVIAYYSLVVSEVQNAGASRLTKGLSRHPVPTIKLARLAVDARYQGRGIGVFLLTDALERALHVSQIVGARAVIVDPIDEAADRFYEKFGFESLKEKTGSHEGCRFLLIKDLEKLLLPAGRHHEADH